MSTPTLKLLLNALRLGQPQDPQAAIFALAEHVLAQDELIEDLKKRITVVQSAAQILETKASRLEAELEGWQQVFANMQPGLGGQAGSSHAQLEREHARFQAEQARAEQARAEQARAEQARAQQQQQQQQRQQPFSPQLVPHGQAQHGPQPAAYQPPRPPSQRPPSMSDGGPQSQPPPSMGAQQRTPSVAPRPASEPPPPFPSPGANNDAPNYNNRREGTDPVRTRMVRSTPQMTRQQRADAMRAGRDALVSDEDSSSDDFKVETVVVHKKDLEKLKNQHPEAPFRLPPPGAGVGPDRGSIPGAPWARGNRVDIKVRPAVADEFTIDSIHHENVGRQAGRDFGDDDEESRDDEGETYRDAGGLPSLAAALGLSPGDPRLEALRRRRELESVIERDRASDDDVPTSSRRKR